MKKSKTNKTAKRSHVAHQRRVMTPEPPKPEPVSTDGLKKMSEDMRAIWLLCETRSHEGLDAAMDMARRISYNDVIFTIIKLQKEWREKPALEGHFLPVS